MDSTTLKAQIDSQITNETLPNSITPAEVGGNLKAVVDYVDQGEYSIMLTQLGTNAPVASTIFRNTIGAIVWSRNSIGNYSATLTGAFPVGATKITPTTYYDKATGRSYQASWIDANMIGILAFDDAGSPADLGLFEATDFTIRVYE